MRLKLDDLNATEGFHTSNLSFQTKAGYTIQIPKEQRHPCVEEYGVLRARLGWIRPVWGGSCQNSSGRIAETLANRTTKIPQVFL